MKEWLINGITFSVAILLCEMCVHSCSPCVYKLGGISDRLCIFPADES